MITMNHACMFHIRAPKAIEVSSSHYFNDCKCLEEESLPKSVGED